MSAFQCLGGIALQSRPAWPRDSAWEALRKLWGAGAACIHVRCGAGQAACSGRLQGHAHAAGSADIVIPRGGAKARVAVWHGRACV